MSHKLISPLFLVLAILSCQTPKEKIHVSEQVATTTEAMDDTPALKEKDPNGIYVKDSFDYSRKFLSSMEAAGIKNARLEDDQLIIDSVQQYKFPNHLHVFKMNAFFGEEKDLHIKLLAERINQTTVSYSLLAGPGHDLEIIQEGGAELAGDFFRMKKTDINELTGNQFPVEEYTDVDGDCITKITLGKEGDSKLMARISKACNGQPVPLATNTPLLLIGQ